VGGSGKVEDRLWIIDYRIWLRCKAWFMKLELCKLFRSFL